MTPLGDAARLPDVGLVSALTGGASGEEERNGEGHADGYTCLCRVVGIEQVGTCDGREQRILTGRTKGGFRGL